MAAFRPGLHHRRDAVSADAGPVDGSTTPSAADTPADTRTRRARLAQRADEARARVEQTRRQLEAQRPTNRGVDAAFRWVQLQVEAGGALLAGAIAFRIFLFLLPWVFVMVMGLGIGTDALHGDPRNVARSLGMAGLAASAVQSGADASATAKWVTFGFAAVALVLGARNLTRALLVTHALVWRVPPRRVTRLTRNSLVVMGVFLAGTFVVALLSRVQSTSPVAWLAAPCCWC